MTETIFLTALTLAVLASAFFYWRSKRKCQAKKISKIRAAAALGVIALIAVFSEAAGFAGGVSPFLMAAGAVLIALG